MATGRNAQSRGMNDRVEMVAADVARLETLFVNLYFISKAGADDRSWVLVDAGLPGSIRTIKRAAERRYGPHSRPHAILLTHGHFDHVGALEQLAEYWDVPVYAHPLELPYLTGQSDYAPPDPTVGGGMMARLSWMYPRGGIDLGGRVQALPEDGSVPGLSEWTWLHTPGHTAGHVSFFRERDRFCLAGDAVVTMRQESVLGVLTHRERVWRPPAYFTTNWIDARTSVERLADLSPEILATGHGNPLRGNAMQEELRTLAYDFEQVAVPRQGRYVAEPAIHDERGLVRLPPLPSYTVSNTAKRAAATVAGLGLTGWVVRSMRDVG